MNPFRKSRSDIDNLIAKHDISDEVIANTVYNPSKLAELRAKHGIECDLSETFPIAESNRDWVKLVHYSYNGVPICHDGDSGKMIKFAGPLEDIILKREARPISNFNPNTINFQTKDVLILFSNFPDYLNFLRKNYALAYTASIVGNRTDSPEFPFFNQFSFAIKTLGFPGANPLLTQKLGRTDNSMLLQSEGKAPLDRYIPDRFMSLYKQLLFERRATSIETSNDGRIVATSSDYFLRYTSSMTMEELLSLATASFGLEVQSERYVLSVNAGEEPAGLLTSIGKNIRKIPGMKYIL